MSFILRFGAYDSKKPQRPGETHAGAVFSVLFTAVDQSPAEGTSRAELLRQLELLRKLRSAAEEVEVSGPNGEVAYTYRLHEYGEKAIELTDAEAAQLREDWKALRKRLGRGAAALILAVDDLLAIDEPT